MNSGEEVSRGLFVARRDAPEVFDGVEEALDEIAFGIEREIARALNLPVGLWRDDRDDVAYLEAGNEAIGVISLVGDHGFRRSLGGKRFGLGDVVNLAPGEADREGIAQGVDDGVDLGGQPAPRAPDGVVLAPFFRAPALCW